MVCLKRKRLLGGFRFSFLECERGKRNEEIGDSFVFIFMFIFIALNHHSYDSCVCVWSLLSVSVGDGGEGLAPPFVRSNCQYEFHLHIS